MSCVKNCEQEVPEVNARPIGLDFGLPWLFPSAFQDPKNLKVSQVETNYWLGALLTVLHGSVLVHYMPQILNDLGLNPSIVFAAPALNGPFLAHSTVTAGLLALPGLLSLAADSLSMPLETITRKLQNRWGKIDQKAILGRRLVIDLYQSMMKSGKSIQEGLKDLDGDGKISSWEVERALSNIGVPRNEGKTLVQLMKNRFGSFDCVPVETWIDNFQQLYLEAQEEERDYETTRQSPRFPFENTLQTKKTFVEIFDELDKDHDGFIEEQEFMGLLAKNGIEITEEEKHSLFAAADVLHEGRLNLFEFMSTMRKIVRVGIQEIGYGYLPLAWAALTAYWLNTGLSELGLALYRLPDTFNIGHFLPFPQFSASQPVIEVVQACLILGAIPPSISLLEKLCKDNNISGVRFGLHAIIQVIGAWFTLYLMLSTAQNGVIALE